MVSEHLTCKEAYEQCDESGELYGQIGERDLRRFKDILFYLEENATSLLDVGCFSGHWLHMVLKSRPQVSKHLGIDVSEKHVEDARRRFPELNVRSGYAEQLDLPANSFDVVTCLEVLEHIPDWLRVFESLFRFAAKQVLITVPYKQEIIMTPCIHCGRLTPLYGHLRSYSESSFPDVPGWSKHLRRLRRRGPELSLLRRVYRILVGHYSWLLVEYRRVVPGAG